MSVQLWLEGMAIRFCSSFAVQLRLCQFTTLELHSLCVNEPDCQDLRRLCNV